MNSSLTTATPASSPVATYVQQTGQGPDLVLLHGWGLHGGIFDTIVPALARDFRVTAVDLPGFGRSPRPESLDLDALVAGVLAVLPERAHVLGWSLGGMVAMALAARHGERIASLVTVASQPCFRAKDDWPHAMKLSVLDNFTYQLEGDYQDTLQKFLALQALGSEHAREDIRLLKDTVFAHGPADPVSLRAGLAILHDADLRAELAAIRAPWLRLYGKLDGLIPVRSAAQHATLAPNSREYIFAKASHAPFISHREEFLDVVLGFLRNPSEPRHDA